MACSKLIRLASQKFSTRKFHATAERSSDWRGLMKKELESGNYERQEQSDPACIYRVPSNMLRVEPQAYKPNNISIGPYHYGALRLQKMETLKKKFYCRLFGPKSVNGAKLEEAFNLLEKEEANARRCYMDEIKLGRDEFLQMMLIDGSFIIQLLRDLSRCEIGEVRYLKRWMLPIFRHELIMLENQLPMSVLSKLFELTENSPRMNLKALALEFFYPLLQVGSECEKANEFEECHFLDLFRSSIGPKIMGQTPRGSQQHMIRSITELKWAGVKIKPGEKRELLDISFGKNRGILMRELTIPPLYINDYKGTVFRNIVAFEKCHKGCKADVTTYLFFLNGLINSADDVALLHHKGVLHHSLGSDRAVAELINNISKEMTLEKNESYLYNVVTEANSYFNSFYAKKRATLVHYYLTSWVVGISTIGAVLALYFTFIQTVCGFADALDSLKSNSFGSLFVAALVTPIRGTPSSAGAGPDSKAKVDAAQGKHDSI